MRWLQLLRAGPRRIAILAVGGLLAAIAIAGVIGLLLNQHVKETIEEALQYDIELESRASEVREAVLDLSQYHRSLAIAGPSRAREIDNFEQAYALLQEKIDRLEELGVRVSDAPQPDQLRQMAESYYADFRPAIDEYDSSNPEEFAVASNLSLQQLADLERAAWEIESLNKERLKAALDTVAAANDTARVVLLARIGGLLLIGAVLAYVTVRTMAELRGLYAREKKVAEELAEVAEELGESEERFRRLAENAQDLIYRLRLAPALEFEYVSPSVEAITGYTPEEHYADPELGFKRLHPEDRRLLEASIRSPETPLLLRWYRKDGSLIWIEQRNKPIFDEAGDLVALEGIGRDVTQDKRVKALRRADEALQYQLDLTRTITNNAADSLFLWDVEGRITFMNPAAEQTFGWRQEELLGEVLHDIMHHHYPDGRPYPISECPLVRVAESGQTLRDHEDLFFRRDGSPLDVACSRAPIVVDGKITGTVLVVRDITKRKRAEEALRRSEAHYSAVVDTAFDAIVTITADGTVRSFNQGAERIFGYTAREAIGQPLTLLMPEQFRRRHEVGLNHYLRTGETRIVGQRMIELVGRRKDGEEFPLELSIAEVREGEDLLFTGIMRDITDRKRIEEELATSLQSKADFLADVSHELRTPLTVIRTNAEVGLEIERNCTHTRLLEEITKGSVRMSRLIEDLLFLARSDSDSPPLELEPVAVPLFLAEVVERAEALARARGVTFEARLAGKGRLRIDPDRIEQAVLILVDNAAKYSPPGSLVTLASTTGDDELCVSVQDTGPGIAEADLPHIFERFYRGSKMMRTDDRSRGGSGLGLAIACAIAEIHSGRIEAESHLGEGTRMSLYLPLTSTSRPANQDIATSNPETRPESVLSS